MTQRAVILSSEAGTARIELARPQRGNALSAEMVETLLLMLDEVLADQTVHSLILTGQGRHFCTGFDLTGLNELSDGNLLQRFVRIETLLNRLWEAPIRTVACAHGCTWGAGADLFTVCDIRVASEDTRFRFPGAEFGIVLGTRRLATRIDESRAREVVTTGVELSADDAASAGLVSAVLNNSSSLEEWLADLPAPAICKETLAMINAATRQADRDRDLADLVRSASRPGLRNRLDAYMAKRIRN